MSSSTRVPQNVHIPRTTPSRIDFIQAMTGVALILFLLAHTLLVSSVILSPKIMDWIGWILEETALAQIGVPVILVLIVFHFLVAARKMPFRTGEFKTFWNNAKSMRHADTWLWVVQVVSAIVILVMASIHGYVELISFPGSAVKSAERVQSGWMLFHLVLIPMAVLHLTIGLYRLGVKYGYISRATRPLWRRRTLYLTGAMLGLWLASLLRLQFLAV